MAFKGQLYQPQESKQLRTVLWYCKRLQFGVLRVLDDVPFAAAEKRMDTAQASGAQCSVSARLAEHPSCIASVFCGLEFKRLSVAGLPE